MACLVLRDEEYEGPVNRAIDICVSEFKDVTLVIYAYDMIHTIKTLKGDTLGLDYRCVSRMVRSIANKMQGQSLHIVSFCFMDNVRDFESELHGHKRIYFRDERLTHRNKEYDFTCGDDTLLFLGGNTFGELRKALRHKNKKNGDLKQTLLTAIEKRDEYLLRDAVDKIELDSVKNAMRRRELHNLRLTMKLSEPYEMETIRSEVRINGPIVKDLEHEGLFGVSKKTGLTRCWVLSSLAFGELDYVLAESFSYESYKKLRPWASVLYKNKSLTTVFELLEDTTSLYYDVIQMNCVLVLNFDKNLSEAINCCSLSKLKSVCGSLSLAKAIIKFTGAKIDTMDWETKENFRRLPIKTLIYQGRLQAMATFKELNRKRNETINETIAHILGVIFGMSKDSANDYIHSSRSKAKSIDHFLNSTNEREYSKLIKNYYEEGGINVIVNALKRFACDDRAAKVRIIKSLKFTIDGKETLIKGKCIYSKKTLRKIGTPYGGKTTHIIGH